VSRSVSKECIRLRRLASTLIFIAFAAASIPALAQKTTSDNSTPAAALVDALTAACREDPAAFATHLTSDSSKAFQHLSEAQQLAVMKRFVLLEQPGKPLLSGSPEGHTVLRCEAGGVVSEMRLGATQVDNNLAFIPVEVPEAADQTQSIRFGLIRQNGEWKLLSLGLLLLDIPAMAHEWEAAAGHARETQVVSDLRKIADALKSYQRAYGNLPETLDQLGPPGEAGISPEKAGLLDAQLASGEADGYHFRYSIVPAAGEGDESERNKEAGFSLGATPVEYGKTGVISFYNDASGVIRGGDKHGAVATPDDPLIAPQPLQAQP